MGRKLTLRAADGFELGAWRADPAGPARGRVVVIQEIFGVNRHIRAVCERLAGAGYVALAPQIFDRIERDFESGYADAEVAHARTFIPRLDGDKAMMDTEAAIDALKREGAVAVVGFCLGGSMSYVAATRVGGLAAAVCYYGGQIVRHVDEQPRCPVQMHFGGLDTHIPLADVETIRHQRPEAEIYVYQHAGHGFHCDERGSYDQPSARIAWERTLGFLGRGFASTAQEMDEPVFSAPAAQVAKQGAAEAVRRAPRKAPKKKPKAKKKAAGKKTVKKKAAKTAKRRPAKKKAAGKAVKKARKAGRRKSGRRR